MTEAFEHIPVLRREVEGLLALKAGDIYVDATLGFGGHASDAAAKLGADGQIIGLDQDEHAIQYASRTLESFVGKKHIAHVNFSKIDEVLAGLHIEAVSAVLFDLGVSSLQLDDPQRGFSFRSEAPLDMRMNRDADLTAADLVNSLSEEELASMFWTLGEERFSRRISHAIIRARAARPIETTTQLADLVLRALPRGYQRGRIHPATRVFQALRIAVNRELESLEAALLKAFDALNSGGRLVIISFHSLEDRIVKEKFRELARIGRARLLTKKPLRPAEDEIQANSRASSARLRAVEKVT